MASPAPADRPHLVNVAIWITLMPTIMAVASKIITKWFMARKLWLDDLTLLVALLFATAQVVATTVQVNSGLGRDFGELSSDESRHFLVGAYVAQLFYVLTIYTTKLTALYFFTCLCAGWQARRIVYAVNAFLYVWLLIVGLVATLQCETPDTWDSVRGKCVNAAFWTANAAVDILTQIVIAFMPIYLLRSMNMSNTSRKAFSMLSFTPNALTIPLSILRLIYLYVVARDGNVSRTSTNLVLVTALHALFTVMAASLPFAKAVVDSLVCQAFLIGDGPPLPDHTGYFNNYISGTTRRGSASTRKDSVATHKGSNGIGPAPKQKQLSVTEAAVLSDRVSRWPYSQKSRDPMDFQRVSAETLDVGNFTSICSQREGNAGFQEWPEENRAESDGSREKMVIHQTKTATVISSDAVKSTSEDCGI